MFFEIFLLLCTRNHPHSSVSRWIMDIFDELMVTKSMLRNISIRMSSFCLYVDAEKLNKFTSYFVDCICVWLIFCCWHWQIPALLMLLMISYGMLICQWAHLLVDQRSLGTFDLKKPSKTQPKKLERPEGWYEIDEKWHFLWDFIWIFEQYIVYTHLSRLSFVKKTRKPHYYTPSLRLGARPRGRATVVRHVYT